MPTVTEYSPIDRNIIRSHPENQQLSAYYDAGNQFDKEAVLQSIQIFLQENPAAFAVFAHPDDMAGWMNTKFIEYTTTDLAKAHSLESVATSIWHAISNRGGWNLWPRMLVYFVDGVSTHEEAEAAVKNSI